MNIGDFLAGEDGSFGGGGDNGKAPIIIIIALILIGVLYLFLTSDGCEICVGDGEKCEKQFKHCEIQKTRRK
jgi:hypothetical protein